MNNSLILAVVIAVFLGIVGWMASTHRRTCRALQVSLQELAEKQQALENLYQQLSDQVEKARLIHRRVLPPELPKVSPFALAAYHQPAEFLGGDFYYAAPLDHGLLNSLFRQTVIYLVDVSGHGLDSAMLALFVKDVLDGLICDHPGGTLLSPSTLLTGLRQAFCAEDFPEDYLVCLLVGVLDQNSGEFIFSSAGIQVPPCLVRGGQVQELPCGGLPISNSIDDTAIDYSQHTIRLQSGDCLLLSTDGLWEERRNDTLFAERLPDILAETGGLCAEQVVSRIAAAQESFRGGAVPQDDVTLVVVTSEEEQKEVF